MYISRQPRQLCEIHGQIDTHVVLCLAVAHRHSDIAQAGKSAQEVPFQGVCSGYPPTIKEGRIKSDRVYCIGIIDYVLGSPIRYPPSCVISTNLNLTYGHRAVHLKRIVVSARGSRLS